MLHNNMELNPPVIKKGTADEFACLHFEVVHSAVRRGSNEDTLPNIKFMSTNQSLRKKRKTESIRHAVSLEALQYKENSGKERLPRSAAKT